MLHSQRGFCDLGCDIPDFDGCFALGEFASDCDCGSCDSTSKRGNREDERDIHIPPNVKGKAGDAI